VNAPFDERLLRYLEGRATEEERAELERTLTASPRLRAELDEARKGLAAIRGLAGDLDTAVPPLAERSWRRATGSERAARSRGPRGPWRRAAAIAALFLLPASGWFARGFVEPQGARLPPLDPRITGSARVAPNPQLGQYLLLFTGAWPDMSAMSPDQRFERQEAYMTWLGELERAGVLVTGSELGTEPGLFLTSAGMGVAEFVPDLPPEEVVVGYVVIRAENEEEARRIASECPHVRYGSGVLLKGGGPGM
jgi:hypothetical protein